MLNKTAQSNLKYIAIVIGILMLLPFFNRITTAVEEYRGPRGTRRRRDTREGRRAPIKESARSKARRKAKKCKYASRRMRKKLGC
jgi:hypothetical protein